MTVNSLTISANNIFDLVDSGYTLTIVGAGTPLTATGILDPGTSSTVNYTGAGATNVTAIPYNNLEVNGNSTYTLVGTTNVSGDLVVADGTLAVNTRTLTVTGSVSINSGDALTISSGTLDVTGSITFPGTLSSSGASNIIVGGNWDATSGTFTSGTGTVTFDGTDLQTVTAGGTGADDDFTNIVVTNTHADGTVFADAFTTVNFTCETASAKLTFNAGDTYTISGTLTLNRQATGTRITLLSDFASTKFTFDVTDGDQNVSYVNVTDSQASSNNITAANSVATRTDKSEATPHWICGSDIWGYIYDGWEGAALGLDVSVRLVVNGSLVDTVTSALDTGNRKYIFSSVTLADGDDILVYIDGQASYDANSVTVSSGGADITKLHLYDGYFVTGNDSTGTGAGTTITNAILNSALGAYTDAGDINFSISIASGIDVTTVSGNGLAVPTGITYTPGDSNDVTVTAADCKVDGTLNIGAATFALATSGTLDIDGTMNLDHASSVIDAAGMIDLDGVLDATGVAANIFVAGNWDSTNGTFTAGSGTVTFDGTTTQTIAGTNTWNNLYISNSYGTPSDTYDVDAAAVQTVAGTLTVNDGQYSAYAGDDYVNVVISSGGTLKPDNGTITVSGNWTNSGTFTSGSGTVTFDGAGESELTGTLSFENMTINKSSAGVDVEAKADLDVNGILTITQGDLDLDDSDVNVTIAGNLSVASAGAVLKSSNTAKTVKFDGTGTSTWTDTDGDQDLGTVVIDGTAKRIELASSASATSLTIGADDTFDIGDGGYTFTLTGTGTPFVIGGTFDDGTDSMFKYTGAGTTNVTQTTYHDLEFDDSGATGHYDITGSTTVSGGLTITDGTVDLDGNTFDVNGSISVAADGLLDFDYNNATASQSMTVGGSWTNVGTFTSRQGNVTFDGTLAQTVVSGGDSFYDVTITNDTADIDVATNALTIANNLIISEGVTASIDAANVMVTVGGTVDGVDGGAVETLSIDTGSASVSFNTVGSGDADMLTALTISNAAQTDFNGAVNIAGALTQTNAATGSTTFASTVSVGTATLRGTAYSVESSFASTGAIEVINSGIFTKGATGAITAGGGFFNYRCSKFSKQYNYHK